jgi:hypothetical protein
MREQQMKIAIFKVMGGFVLLFAAAPLFVVILALISRSPRFERLLATPEFFIRLIAVVVLLGVVGFGLLQLRKWAALLFSGLTLCLAFAGVWTAIYPVAPRPGDANWLGFVYAAVLIVPSILTARCWHTLTWRKGRSRGDATS